MSCVSVCVIVFLYWHACHSSKKSSRALSEVRCFLHTSAPVQMLKPPNSSGSVVHGDASQWNLL